MLRWAATKLSGVEKEVEEEEEEEGKKKADQGHQDLDQGQEDDTSCRWHKWEASGCQVAMEAAVGVRRAEFKLP